MQSSSKVGFVKIQQYREIPEGYTLKSVTVSKAASGKYYAFILYEYETVITPIIPNVNKVVGLDFFMNRLYATSVGEFADYPSFYRQSLVN